MSLIQRCSFLVILTAYCFVSPAQAGNIWDGGGAADANWTTNTNWDSDTAPAFAGTEALTINSINALGTATTLNGDKNILSLTTNPSQAYSINNDTLTIQSGNITTGSNQVTMNSNVALGNNGSFSVSGNGMVVNGVISGGFNLTKVGTGQLTLNGASSYTGQTFMNQGTLAISNNVAVNTNGPIGNGSSALVIGQLAGTAVTFDMTGSGQTFGRDIQVSSSGSGSVRIESFPGSAINTLSGNLDIGRDTVIYANHSNSGHYLNITGVISGAGNLAIHRNVRLAAANTYTGTTTIGEHPNFFTYLAADAPNGAPGAFGNATSDVVLASSGLFFDGTYTIGRNLNQTGNFSITQRLSGVGTIDGNLNMPNATTLTLSVEAGSASQVFNGVISGIGGINRNGGQGFRTYFNNANNSYSGTTMVQIGDLVVGANAPSGSNGALGNSTSAVIFSQGHPAHNSSLLINGAFTIGRDVNLANTFNGAITTLGGITADNSAFTGGIAINSNSTADLTAISGGTVTFSGALSGAGKVEKVGAGTVILSGSGSNYSGLTTVTQGVLTVAANNALGDTTTGTTVNNGTTLGFQGNINYSTAEAVTVGGVGVSSLGALRNISGTNTFAGPVTLSTNTFFGADAGRLNLSGVVTDGASTFTLAKVGNGTVSLSSATGNTYNGSTTVVAGTLLANNTSGSATGTGNISISSGGTLGGSGFITGNVTAAAGGLLAPGNSAGTLTMTGNVAFTNNTSQYVVELGGAGSDQLVVNGGVTLANATLNASVLNDIVPTSQIYILTNDSTDAVSGTFNGLANGAIVNLGLFFGQTATAQISYFGDVNLGTLVGGNDIVLYNFENTLSIPEPGTFSLMLIAMGAMVSRRRRLRNAA